MAVVDNMLDLQTVRMGLRKHLVANSATAAGLDTGGKIAIENRNFDPPDDGSMFMRENFMPGTERHIAFKMVEVLGRVQYDCIVRAGSGTKTAEAFALEIAQAFRPGSQPDFFPVVAGKKIAIDRTERLPQRAFGVLGDSQELWVAYSVSISWRAYAT